MKIKNMLIIMILLFFTTGCNLFLPSINKKDNQALDAGEWKPINGETIKRYVK